MQRHGSSRSRATAPPLIGGATPPWYKGRVKGLPSVALLAPIALLVLAPPRLAPAESPDTCASPATLATIEDIRGRAEEGCARRGITCESQVLDYVRCVNATVAAAVRQGRIPRECRLKAEVTPARCKQRTPDVGTRQ